MGRVSRPGLPPSASSVLGRVAVTAAGLILTLAPTAAGAQDRARGPWWDRSAEAKVGYYWIKTDLPADEANDLARQINVMHAEYSKRLASLPQRVPSPLNVLIFKSRDDYLETLRTRFGVNAAGSGGMFFVNPSGSGLAFWTEALSERRVHHVMQHEGFHQFAYSRFGGDLPLWVNEGLAEFFGESVIVGRKLVIGQSNPRVINRVKQAIERGSHVPFSQMLSMTSERWGEALRSGTAGVHYSQAWSMVHFLVYGDNGKYVEAFERYLRFLNGGLPSENAFVRAFGDDIAAFERRWTEYAIAARPSAFLAALERIEFLAEGALELARRGVHPESLEALRDAMREIEFVYLVRKHGLDVKLRADDDAVFTIPAGELTGEPPIFIVSKADPGRLSRRERFLEKTDPSPPAIATEHLRPNVLSVRWHRNPDAAPGSGGFRYEIVVR